MDRNSEILELMRLIAKQGSGIRLVNIYQGMPINYEASIVSIDTNGLHLQCNKHQLACMYLTREVYILGDQIQGAIHATVTGLIPARDEAVLTNLAYLEKPFILRNQIRVEPLEPIILEMKLRGNITSIDARLADISLSGVGIFMDRGFYVPRMFAIGSEVKLIITLPDTVFLRPSTGQTGALPGDITARFSRDGMRGMSFLNETAPLRKPGNTSSLSGPGKISVDGYIVNVRPELAFNLYRLGLHIIQEEKTRLIISQYIALRQAEIIRIFKEVYETLPRR